MKALRTHASLTQGELAERMRADGWSWGQSTVSEVEKGRQALRLVEAAAVADILESRVEDLLRDPLSRLVLELGEPGHPGQPQRFSHTHTARALRLLDETRDGRAPAEFVDNGTGLRRWIAAALLEAPSLTVRDIMVVIGVPRAETAAIERLHELASKADTMLRANREARFADQVWISLTRVLPALAAVKERTLDE